MATVVDLAAEPRLTCPGERAVVTATTDTGEIVDWFVDGVPAEATGDAAGVNGNEFRVRLRQGETKMLEARIDGTAMSLTVEGKVADLRVEFLPEAGGDMPVITAVPDMRRVALTVSGVGGAPADLSLGDVTVTFGAHDCPPNGPIDLRTSFTLPAGGAGVLDFGDVVVGGSLSVRATATVNGCPVGTTGGATIGGTNPALADVRAALPHRVLRGIACRESGMRQFDAPHSGGVGRCPLFGPCGAVGVMGIEDPGRDEVWHWRRNVERGIARFEQCVLDARLYPADVRASPEFLALVAAFNDERADQDLLPIRVQLPDLPDGNFDEDLLELQLDAIRGYDAWTGPPMFGLPLHEFRVAVEDRVGVAFLRVVDVDELALTGSAVWERVPATLRPAGGCTDPDYVDQVLDQLHGCADVSSRRSRRVHCPSRPTRRSAASVRPTAAAGSRSPPGPGRISSRRRARRSGGARRTRPPTGPAQ